MAKTIDSKVVQLAFENNTFEKGVNQSLNTLDKLNSSLDNLAKGDAFSGLQKSIDNIGQHFTVMGQASFAIVQRLTNGIIDLGLEMGKRMIMPPSLYQGFGEYELKMNSVQTILSGTGESLEVVNKYLDELNHYADKTIYSFSDMTTNISKFTNTGVKLEDAVAAIQGIANAAALAGADSQQASIAMFNFSQALSSGYMDRRDWFSIEKSAMMGTVEFKNVLLETAAAMGTAKDLGNGYYQILTTNNAGKTMDNAISATHDFTGSLQHQWMTSKVITAALAKYSDETTELGQRATDAAQRVTTFTKMMDTVKESIVSGWAKSVELVLGDFNEATEMWTLFSKIITGVIDRSADARNSTLEMWRANEGRVQLVSAISNAIIAVYRVLKTIKKAWGNIFPPRTESILASIARGLNAFTSRLVISEQGMERLQETFEGFFAILKFGTTILGGVFDIFLGLAKTVLPIIGKAISLVVIAFGKFFNLVQPGVMWTITAAVQGFVTVLQVVGGIIGGLINRVGSFFGIFKNGTSYFKSFKSVKDIFKNIGGTISSFIETMKTGFNTISDSISNAISNVRSFINVWSSMGSIDGKLAATTNQFNSFGSILQRVYNTLNSISPTLANIVFGTITYIAKFLSTIGKLINIQGILSVAKTVLQGFGAVVLTVFSTIMTSIEPALTTFIGVLGTFKSRISEIFSVFVNQGLSAGLKALIQGFVDLGSGLKTIFASSFTKLGTFLAEFFQSLPDLVSNALVVIQDNIAKLSEEFPVLGKILSIITTVVGTLVQGIANGFGRVGNVLERVLSYFGIMGNSVEEVKTAVEGVTTAPIVQNVANFLNPLAATAAYADEVSTNVEGVATAVTGLSTSVENVGIQVSTIGKGIGARIREFIENINLFDVARNTIQAATFIIGTLVAGFILKMFMSFIRFVGGLVSVMSGLGRVITSFTGALDRYGKEQMSDKVKAFALAIGVLVAALWVLSKIPIEQLMVAVLGVTTLAAILVGTMFLFNKLKIEGSKEIAMSIAMFGATMLLLAMTLKMVSQATAGGSTLSPVVSMIAIIVAIALSLKFLQRTLASGESSAAVSKPMLALAMSLYIIGGVLKKLGSMKPGQLAGGVTALVIAIAALTIPIGILAKMKIRSFAGVGAAFLGLAVGIRVLMGTLTPLYKMKWQVFGAGLAKAFVAMMALTTPLFILAMFPTKKLYSVGSSFLGLAIAVRILTGGLAFLAKQEKVIETGIAITMLLLSMTVALGILGAINITGGDIANIAKTMSKLVLSITALAMATKLLGKVPWDSLKPMAVIFGVAIAALAGLGALAGIFPGFATGMEAVAKAFQAFGIGAIAFSAGVSLLAIGLFLLGTIGTTGLMAFTGYIVFLNGIVSYKMVGKLIAVAAAIGALGYGMTWLAKGVKDITDLGAKGMFSLIVIAGGIILFANALNGSFATIIQAGVILGGFALLIHFLGESLKKISWQMALSFGIIALSMTAFAAAVQDNKVAIGGAIIIIGVLGTVLYHLGGALTLVVWPAVALVAAIGLVIAAIAGLIWVMGNIDPDILKRTFIAIGEGIVEGIIAGFFAIPGAIVAGIKKIGKLIMSGFRTVFGIHSPARLTEPIGSNIILGLLQGMQSEQGNVNDTTGLIGGDILNRLDGFANGAKEKGSKLMSMFNSGLSNGSKNITKTTDTTGNGVSESLNKASSNAGLIGTETGSNFATGIGKNQALVGVNASALTNAASSQFSMAAIEAQINGTDTGAVFGTGIGAPENIVNAELNAIELSSKVVTIFENAINDLRKSGTVIGSEFGNAYSSAVIGRVENLSPRLSQLTSEEVEELREWDIHDFENSFVGKWLTNMGKALEYVQHGVVDDMVNIATSIGDTLGEKWGNFSYKMEGIFLQLGLDFQEWVKNLSFDSFIEGVKDIPRKMATGWRTIKSVVGSSLNNIITGLGDGLANIVGPLVNGVVNLKQTFGQWIDRKWDEAIGFNDVRANRALVMANELEERQKDIDAMFEDPLKDPSIEYYMDVSEAEQELAYKRYKNGLNNQEKYGTETTNLLNKHENFFIREHDALSGRLDDNMTDAQRAARDRARITNDEIDAIITNTENYSKGITITANEITTAYDDINNAAEENSDVMTAENKKIKILADSVGVSSETMLDKIISVFKSPKKAFEEIKTRGWQDVAKEMGFDLGDGFKAGKKFGNDVAEGMAVDASDAGRATGKSYTDGLSEAVRDLDKEWVTGNLAAFNYDQVLSGQRRNIINALRVYTKGAEDCADAERELNELYKQRREMSLGKNTFKEITDMTNRISKARSRLNAAKLSEWQAQQEAARLAKHEANQRYFRASQEKLEEINYKRSLDNLAPLDSIPKADQMALKAALLDDMGAKIWLRRETWKKEHAATKKQAAQQAQADADAEIEAEITGEETVEAARKKRNASKKTPVTGEALVDKTGGASGVATGISSETPKAEAAGKGIVKATTDAITSETNAQQPKVKNAATKTTTTIATALTSDESKGIVKKALDELLAAVLTAVDSDENKSKWNAIGLNLAKGFAAGIESGKLQVELAAGNLATAAKQAAERALQENSPSQVFAKIGKYAAEGFAMGMTATGAIKNVIVNTSNLVGSAIGKIVDAAKNIVNTGSEIGSNLIEGVNQGITHTTGMTNAVNNAGLKIGNDILNAASQGMSNIGDIARQLSTKVSDNLNFDAVSTQFNNLATIISNAISDDMAEPVIKPVVDMTNVTNAASSMNSIFGGQRLNLDGVTANSLNLASMFNAAKLAQVTTQQTKEPPKPNVTNNLTMTMTNTVRNDGDIRKITTNLDGLFKKYGYSQGGTL